MVENKKIPFNFSYYALNLLGKQMYTNNWSAISELVANGLDAGASKVKLYINAVDKKNSILEIIDNGSGMNYSDLSNKYALIGRNRRMSTEEGSSHKTKGRKGIGKLATLYLSKKYYIVTKKNGICSAWVLDSTDAKDSDIPELLEVDVKSVEIENQDIWNTFDSGTLIKSVGVDLTNFGEGKLESLKLILANYYLLDNIGADIEVAYKSQKNEEIIFSKVNKVIAFKNFYSFFQTKKNFIDENKLNNAVKINATNQDVAEKPRPVIRFYPSVEEKINVRGVKKLIDRNGEKKYFLYNLNGWIGIHATINMKESEKNTLTNSKFIRNSVYKANNLRLYVRDKLAVSDFLPYLNNTNALAYYIEGEISFDILDNDNLEDISTSNREDLTSNDERVLLLIKILKPIINRLIRDRGKVGNIVRNEVKEIELEEKRKLEEEKEKERLEKEIEVRKREKAEQEREDERLKKKAAEQKQKQAELDKIEAQQERQREMLARQQAELEKIELKKQNERKDILLSENNTAQQKLLTHELTGIYKGINSVSNNMSEEFRKTGEFDRVSNYILALKEKSSKLYTIKNQILKLNTSEVTGRQYIDLKRYISSYLDSLEHTGIKIIHEFSDNPHQSRVHIFNLGVIIDNLIINALDQNASYVKFLFDDNQNQLRILTDSGPISDIFSDPNEIFELGKTSKANGTGVGMYIVKTFCKNLKWDITIARNEKIIEFVIDVKRN